MPPFRYDTPVNPYVGSIGELMERSGTIEAQRAREVANATAAATVASGNAWGGAVRDIGTNVGGQLLRIGERMGDPAYQLEKEQVTRAQRENKSRNVFEAELRNPANYNEDGTVNDAAITTRLKKQDVGAWQQWSDISAKNAKNSLDLRKELGDIQKTDLEIGEKQRLAQEAQQKYLGGLAFHTEQILKTKADDPLHARDTFMAGIARAVADGGLSGAKAKDVLMRTAQASPEQLQQVIGSLVPEDLRAKFESEAADTAKKRADAEHLAAETANLNKFGRATPPEAQHVDLQLDGKPVKGSFVPDTTGGKYFYNGEDVTARAKPVPPASMTVNPALIPSGDALTMAAQRYLATGELPSMGMGQSGAAARIAVMNAAAKIDPQASLALNKATYKADSTNLTNLQKTEGTLSAFENTAGKNLDQFLTLANKIPDTGVPWLNTPVRLLDEKLVGSANMAAINAARDVALREIARVTNDPKMSGALTDSARQEIQSLSPKNATLPQIKAVVKVLKQDMANVHTGLNEQIAHVKDALAQHPGAAASTPSSAPAEGTEGTVNGRAAIWKTVNGKTGWYAK